ncbi:MAG: chromosome segregation protein SMC [Deltaproteobacteria bacterium]|nr:chromosome segregation protein SMC [Deltaproteobacteria bacterium]
MKLKKLELSGFKSFPEKVSIAFPPGISAVVGPNGCGKSNIFDALRWVMGEQSVKMLRGKTMEDIIFSGSVGKTSLNMAEVSLTLINDNGSAPEELKDFAEIMITRRQYRSGERAYFLNRKPCRLKDIYNIFWGSGMGARSYSVIQQGNIGAITDAGPDERRFFIEEAAGITRYKNKKNEALRKVNATRQNLLRVKDIISEVNRQMNTLKRQAKRAEKYQGYQAMIRELEIIAALRYYDDFSSQIEETDALLKELKDEDVEHVSKLTRLDAAIEEIKFERATKNEELSSQKSHRFEMQRSADRAENEVEHLKKNNEILSAEIEGLGSARLDLESKNQQITSEIDQSEKEIESFKKDIKNYTEVLEKENQASGDLREQLNQLNLKIEEEKSRLTELIAEEARYRNIYQNASNNKESLKRRLKRVDEEEAIAGQKVKNLENRCAEAEKSLQTLKDEKDAIGQEIQKIEAELKDKNEALGRQIKNVQSMELEKSKIKSRHATLVKMDENYEWYRDGVKAVMKRGAEKIVSDSSQPGNEMNGIVGMLADVIEPGQGFEIAVEAVLGESMQYIIVDNQNTGIDAIEYLQTSGAGRSGFIPISAIKVPADKGGNNTLSADQLLAHVTLKPGYEEIGQALLGQVSVVENLSKAISLWAKSNGSGPRAIVTKNGDMISYSGMLIGGSRDKLSGILSKKQEIKDLKKKIVELEHKLDKSHKEQKELEAAVRYCDTRLQKQIEQKNITAEKETDAEKYLYKVSEELKHAKRHFEIVSLEQEQLIGEEIDVDDEISRYSDALAENELRVKAAQNKVTEMSMKISLKTDELEDFNQKVVDIKLKFTSLQANLESSTNTLRRLIEFRDDGMKRFNQLVQEIEQKNRKQKDAEARLSEYSRRLPGIYEKLKLLEHSLESNEEAFQSLEKKLNESDNAISEIQGKREKALEKLRYVELEQSQRRMKQENITNRLKERYHRGLEELKAEMEEKPDSTQTAIEEIEANLEILREKIARISDVNLGAIDEYEELKKRFEFLNEQQDDLEKGLDDLQKVIMKINKITQEKFVKTFNAINEKLSEVFPRLFEGGTARLEMTDPGNPLETGVEMMIQPPGKKLTRLSLLSGGEKALSAIAFIFSIFLLKPASFCLMDEIDAPLDDANVLRFNELLKLIGEHSQVVLVTHNKRSMEFADTLFGVTMEKKGISKIVSVNFEQQSNAA